MSQNQYWGKKPWGPMHVEDVAIVSVPVGEKCMSCKEEVKEDDLGMNMPVVTSLEPPAWHHEPIHRECFLRGVFGSVAHQEQRCSCYGGTEADDEGMTKRQAAIASVELFERRQREARERRPNLQNIPRIEPKVYAARAKEARAELVRMLEDLTGKNEEKMEIVTDWKKEELERLKNMTPENVPLWPLLPMKNSKERKPGGFPTYGVMLAWDKRPIIYKGASVSDLGARQWTEDLPNSRFPALELKGVMPEDQMPELRKKLEKYERLEFITFEALQEAGWMVD